MIRKKSIKFYSEKEKLRISGKKVFRKVILFVLEKEGIFEASIGIVFCTDDYLSVLNKKYLKHDYYTDVIAFDYSDEKGAKEKKIIGEIYISSDRIKENARKYSVSTNEEYMRVMIHGVLHLCGYTDKTDKGKNQMKSKENNYLRYIYKRETP